MIMLETKTGDVPNIVKNALESSIQAYIDLFCKKHDQEFEGWVGNEKASVALIGDHFINFTDIVLDLEKGVDKKHFFDWYYYTLEGETFINYSTYLKNVSNEAKKH